MLITLFVLSTINALAAFILYKQNVKPCSTYTQP